MQGFGHKERALTLEGNDPLRKLQTELEAVQRWQHKVEQEASKYIKQENCVKDPYIREVLRLWPTDNKEGMEHVKNCAWVEGLDANLFTGRNVMVQKVAYDALHNYVLHCSIAKRRGGETDKEQGPPYRLTTCWQWQEVKETVETSPVPMSESLRLDSGSCCAASVAAAKVVQRVWSCQCALRRNTKAFKTFISANMSLRTCWRYSESRPNTASALLSAT